MTHKFRFHVLGIPHTASNKEYIACPFTQNIIKFSKMMFERGHYVIHYGHEKSDLLCNEHITITNDDILNKSYGNYDWKKNGFIHNTNDYANQYFISKAIPAIIKKIQLYDFVICLWGSGHKPIAIEAEKYGAIITEPAIGYFMESYFAKWRAYPSHCLRSALEGLECPQSWYSWVIPHYFDITEFSYKQNKSDYYLYLGRIIEAKGLHTIIKATEIAGVKLKIAGQGSLYDLGYKNIPKHCEEIGYADLNTRKELMSNAKALLIASSYLEPFGCVQIESLLSGTPVIAPFYGAFSEVIENNKTGFLCHSLKEFVDAIKSVDKINPMDCRESGMRYTLDEIAPKFEKWFESIYKVYTEDGWNSLT